VFPEGVFDFLACLSGVGFDLVAFAFGLQPVIAGGIADGFFAFAVQFLGGVVDLICQTLGGSPIWPPRA
jgi:hypothetical protein